MDIKQEFISITLDDGSVAIMGFLTQGRGSELPQGAEWVKGVDGWWSRPANDENIFSEILRTSFGERAVVRYRKINPDDLPKDRTYRNALKDDGVKLDFDMVKAREIHKNRLRRARAKLFEENDLALRDAIIENDDAKLSDATKRRDDLRDVTAFTGIDAAQAIEELKAAIPPVLKGVELD